MKRWLLIPLLLWLVLPGSVGAQPAGELTEEEQQQLERAVRRSEIGQLLYDDHDFLGAAEAWAEAWDLARDIFPDPVLPHNVARAYENAGEYELALAFYQTTLELDLSDHTDLQRRCEEGITRLENILQQIEEDRAQQPAELTIRSTPNGAEVFINGELLGATPVDLELPSGQILFALDRVGYQRHEEQFTLEPGQALVLQITLEPETPATPVDQGGPNWLAVGLVAAGGAGSIGLGALLGVEAGDLHDEAQRPDVLRDDQLFAQTVQEGRGAQTASYIMYSLGGFALATAVFLYFITDDSPPNEPIDQAVHLDLGWGQHGVEGLISLEW